MNRGLVWSHLDFISRDFPKAIFLAQYGDDLWSYGGKIVIHTGDEIRSSYDGDHHAMGCEWALAIYSNRIIDGREDFDQAADAAEEHK